MKKTNNSRFGAEATWTNNGTTLFSHHFDLVVENDPILQIGYSIPFNIISNNPTPYEKLSDIEGDGYIMSAIGMTDDYVLDVRVVHEGNVLMYKTTLDNGEIAGHILFNYADYPVRDSVQKI